MTAAERARHELAARLEETLGSDEAATLMEHLPPVRWDELARQEDLLALRTDVDGLRGDVDGLRADVSGLRTDVDGLQHDVSGLRTDMDGLRGEVGDLRTATLLQGERTDHLTEVMTLRFDGLTDHIAATVAQRMDSQTKLLVLSILGAFLTAVAISVGAASL
jgi:hypothetical protein